MKWTLYLNAWLLHYNKSTSNTDQIRIRCACIVNRHANSTINQSKNGPYNLIACQHALSVIRFRIQYQEKKEMWPWLSLENYKSWYCTKRIFMVVDEARPASTRCHANDVS